MKLYLKKLLIFRPKKKLSIFESGNLIFTTNYSLLVAGSAVAIPTDFFRHARKVFPTHSTDNFDKIRITTY